MLLEVFSIATVIPIVTLILNPESINQKFVSNEFLDSPHDGALVGLEFGATGADGHLTLRGVWRRGDFDDEVVGVELVAEVTDIPYIPAK